MDLTLEERSAARRRRIVGHRAMNHDEAEQWDLEFWQSQGPEMRLSALVAMHREAEAIESIRFEKMPTQQEKKS